MAAKSLRKIDLLVNTDRILAALQDVKDPMTITDIVKATGLTTDTVFRQVGTMEEIRWVDKVGDGYVIGMRLAVIWARKKATLEGQINKLQNNLSEITGGE